MNGLARVSLSGRPDSGWLVSSRSRERDTICLPSTVYAAFNAYAGAKEMVRYTYNDHEGGGPFQEVRQRDWLAQVLPA